VLAHGGAGEVALLGRQHEQAQVRQVEMHSPILAQNPRSLLNFRRLALGLCDCAAAAGARR
jgi:hypothetical protein